MKFNRKLLFKLATLVVSVVLMEAGLNLLAAFYPPVQRIVMSVDYPLVQDTLIGFRPNPHHPEHDKNGFRNPSVPDQVDIVAMGDSQTYGVGVDEKHTFPYLLGQKTKKEVYNLAYGGYCPVHSLGLWPDALELKPKIIIEAFYSGNDLFDAFDLVYSKGSFASLKSKDITILQRIDSLESEESYVDKVINIFNADTNHTEENSFIRVFLSKHSRLYGLIRTCWNAVKEKMHPISETEKWQSEIDATNKLQEYREIFQKDTIKTVFTSEYRLTALNIQDARIREGLHLALSAILRMKELADQENISYLVVCIPTKELVFKDISTSKRAAYCQLVENEEMVWDQAIYFFMANHIDYVNCYYPLVLALKNGHQPFHPSADGHLNNLGQTLVANLIYVFFMQSKILESY